MINFVYDYGLVLELILVFGLFTISLKKRSFFVLRVIADVLVIALFCYLRKVIPDDILLIRMFKYIVLYIVCFGLCIFTFKAPWRVIFFCFVSAIISQHISYTLSDMFRQLILVGDPNFPQIALGAIYSASTLTIDLLLYYFFSSKVDPKDYQKVQAAIIIPISALMLLVCIVVLQFFEYYRPTVTVPYYILFVVLDTTCCISTLLISYVSYISARNTVETELVKQRLNQYNQLQGVVETMNIRLHDLKHQIKKIEKENQVDPEVLKDLKDTMAKYQSFARVGNDTLNTILTEKNIICEKNNIKFTYIIDGKLFDHFHVSDINSLFGNAFDNAIEYLCTVPEENRFLSVRSSIMGSLAKISIENYYVGKVSFNKEGLLDTTKENASFHGFGLKSIRSIIKKYHGNMTITIENNVFKLQLLLPVVKEEKE